MKKLSLSLPVLLAAQSALATDLFYDCKVSLSNAATGIELHQAVLKTREAATFNPVYDENGELVELTAGRRPYGAGSDCLGNRDILGPTYVAPNGELKSDILVFGKTRVYAETPRVFIDYCFKMSDGHSDGEPGHGGYAEIYLARRALPSGMDWLASAPIRYLDQTRPLILRGNTSGEIRLEGYVLKASCTLSENP